MSTKHYILTMSAEHAQVLKSALDLYSRIGCGQFEEVLNVFDRDMKRPLGDCNACRDSLNLAKYQIAGFLPGGSNSIHSAEVDDEFRVAFDLLQVVRHRMAHDARPEGNPLNVNFDHPHQGSKVPLAIIESKPGNPGESEWHYCAVHHHDQNTPCPKCDPAEPKPEPT